MSTTDNFHWQGRQDSEDGDAGHRWHNRVSHNAAHQAVALHGYSCDKGVAANKGRIGAKNGPDAIRAALANIAWHLPGGAYDAGNTSESESLPHTQDHYANTINALLSDHELVIGLGGGHDIAWGSYLGLSENLKHRPDNTIGIINFDAHFDLRVPAPDTSSGTPFYQVAQHCEQTRQAFHYGCLGIAETSNTRALFERADTLQVAYLSDMQCSMSATRELLIPMLNQVDELYVTVCLDVFSADQAPGVSAPSAFGIEPGYVIETLHWLAACQESFGYRWRLTDIAEMNPRFDIDGRTAKLAARLIHEVCKAHFCQTG